MPQSYEVFSADAQVLKLRHLFSSMIQGVRCSPYAAYRLFIKDIKADYSQSALGVIWDFLDPLILAGIFSLLMRHGVIDIGDINMPRPIYVIYGVLLYQSFADTLTYTTSIIKRSKDLLSHTRVYPEALILSCLFRSLFFSFFRVVIMLLFSLALMHSAEAESLHAFSLTGFLKFLLAFPLIILPGMAFGVLLAPLSVIYGDIERGTRLILRPMRYASPVIWPIPWVWLNTWNPIALILVNLRLLATSDALENVGGLVFRCGLFVGIFLAGWLVFHVSVPVIAAKN